MLRVMLYDRFDQPLGELSENEVFGLVRTERINGEHSLKITTTRVLEKGQRILTCDARGKWREHVVYGTDALHDSGEKPFGEYYCVWSVQHDLVGTRISAMPGVQNPVAAAVALTAALSGTERWAIGTVTNTNTGGASMYDTDGWSGLSTLVNVWGGEIDATIEVGSTGVTARKVDLYSMQGDQDAKRRFDFGADIKSVRRKMDDSALYCRITPRGMGAESGAGYGRKITIESVNDGKDYLENQDMVPLAKLPDGNGGWEYPTLEVENSECTTPQELLDWALSVLEYYTVPRITYVIDVLQLAQEGVDMHGVSLGDAVHIVDRKFGDGLRTSGRVVQTVVNMLDEADMQVTVGCIGNDIADVIANMEARLATVADTLGSVGMGTSEYYSFMLARLNEQINATGGYTYITEGEGIRVYDTAVTDPKAGDEASAAVEIKGGTIRIANSKTAQGAWEWKSVFTSGHIAADLVTAAHITAGYIGSAGDTFIDLDNSIVQLGQSTKGHIVVEENGLTIYGKKPGAVDVSEVIARMGYAGAGSTGHPKFTLGSRASGTTEAEGSIAIGWLNEASGTHTVAIGSNNKSTGQDSFAFGEYCESTGIGSVAVGDFCKAGQSGSFAAGHGATVSGPSMGAVALCEATSSGNSSCAVNKSTASGTYSFAAGNGTSVSGDSCAVFGRHNLTGTDPITVGWGTSSSKKNILKLDSTGNMTIAGTLVQNSDRRLKDHRAYLGEDACDFVRNLKPALYTKDRERHVGFYAQDVQDADPWGTATVSPDHSDESLGFDPLALDYTALIAPLVAYCQHLEKRIEALEEGRRHE